MKFFVCCHSSYRERNSIANLATIEAWIRKKALLHIIANRWANKGFLQFSWWKAQVCQPPSYLTLMAYGWLFPKSNYGQKKSKNHLLLFHQQVVYGWTIDILECLVYQKLENSIQLSKFWINNMWDVRFQVSRRLFICKQPTH